MRAKRKLCVLFLFPNHIFSHRNTNFRLRSPHFPMFF